MPWVQLRSPRDPAVWVPLLTILLLLLPVAFLAHSWLSDWGSRLRELAASDPSAAQAEATRLLRLASWSLCVVMAGFSAFFFRYFQLGRREARLPPSGWWSLGAFRVMVGPRARQLSRFGMLLSWALLIATIGLALAVEHLIRLIATGRLAA